MHSQGGTVGRECDIDTEPGQAFHQPRQMGAHKGLAARQTNALEAETLDADASELLDLLEAQDL